MGSHSQYHRNCGPGIKMVTKTKPDFILGQRGRTWYAFANNKQASEYIRLNGVQKSDKLYELFEKLEALQFTCEQEPE